MGNDDIREVNLLKSARLGYTKMLLAALAYHAEHKRRNSMVFQPTNGAAEEFSKQHIDPMIRDVPCILDLFPWHDMKHKWNTMDYKRFSNSRQIHIKGGQAAKNYREKSVDNIVLDELSSFDPDIEREGSPLVLADKRTEGAAFPKSIRGSTPKVAGECQMTMAAEEADEWFLRYLPCPHCEEEQHLIFGDAKTDHGFTWIDNDPKTAAYCCKHCHALIKNDQLTWMDKRGRWISKNGIVTVDGLTFHNAEGELVDPPESVTWEIWSAYSPWSTWTKIVKDFLKAKGDATKLKSWTNTTRGLAWQETRTVVEPEVIHGRREKYHEQVPAAVHILTGTVDVQDDRLECLVVGWSDDEESYSINHHVLTGDPSKPLIWQKLKEHIFKEYRHEDGYTVPVPFWLIDSGGHYTDEVYKFCKANEAKIRPLKGLSTYGQPIVDVVRKRNKNGVFLHHIGTDTAKGLLAARIATTDPGAGYMHFPVDTSHDIKYFNQLTAERRIKKKVGGRVRWVWDAANRRNEITDLWVYNLACLRVLMTLANEDLVGFKARALKLKQKAELQVTNSPVYQNQPAPSQGRRVRSRGLT